MIPRWLSIVAALALTSPALAQSGNSERGARAFRACAACHSLDPGRNMTGPSLAGVVGRKAATAPGFDRYSEALKASHLTWDATTLDRWLADPQHLVPGNTMTFPGIPDANVRADLLAFLKAPPQTTKRQAPAPGMMGGMMGGGAVPHLKTVGQEARVKSIAYCRDTYRVTTADGRTHAFWERNLRFKTDSSEDGPEKGAPAIVGAGMMGDRASVIFAQPEEISRFIAPGC